MRNYKYLYILLFLFLSSQFQSFSQILWTKISESEINKIELRPRSTMPYTYQLFSLDLNLMKQQLQNVPLENQSLISPNIIYFPDSEGKITIFSVFEAPIMEPELRVKHPSLKSYIAVGVEHPKTSLRISITDFGLHAMSVTNENGTYFIDSYTKDSSKYILYYKKDCKPTKNFSCQTNIESKITKFENSITKSKRSNDGIFRQYRMAMTTNAAFSQFHINAAGAANGTLLQQKSAVLSALVVIMTRINGVYERDLGIRMNLVANNDLLILIGPDAFEFTEANILNENIAYINSNIGIDNYDIGHLVTTIGYNMGVAALCAFDKAAGTTGSDSPVGDPFVIDYLAHEIGHQFGAGHTFYSTCGDQADEAVSVEPGSGSSIMSYAGICAPSVQNHSDSYFTTASILQIQNFINQPERNCSNASLSGSVTPVIVPLNNYTIPYGTPFVLNGNASSTNQNLLTYCWEQIDLDSPYDNPQPQPPLNTNILGPNFRSFFPNYSPNRYMPNFSSVLQGKLYKKWEVISNVARTMKFALTVRDNNLINGGQTQTDDNQITVANVGPFKITSPSLINANFSSGTFHNVTWDIAGTTSNGINTATVTILISTDSGATFTPLISNTPNDGSETIQFPNIQSAYCRIMIKADNNIYYAVSNNFSLGYFLTTSCTTYTDNQTIPVTYNNGAYVTKIVNVPSYGIISDVNLHTLINHSFISQCEIYLSSPTNPNDFIHINNGFCYGSEGLLNLTYDDEGSDVNCELAGTNQNVTPYEPLSAFIGQNQQGNWNLRIYDTWEGDDGTITDWGIDICSEIATLGNSNPDDIIGFSIVPNPADNLLSIQFNANNAEPIEINIYDNLGRIVWNNQYNNLLKVDDTIDISKFQSSIYLVSVKCGNQYFCKKLSVN